MMSKVKGTRAKHVNAEYQKDVTPAYMKGLCPDMAAISFVRVSGKNQKPAFQAKYLKIKKGKKGTFSSWPTAKSPNMQAAFFNVVNWMWQLVMRNTKPKAYRI